MAGSSYYLPKSPGHRSSSMRNPVPWKPTGKLNVTFPSSDLERPFSRSRSAMTARRPSSSKDEVDGGAAEADGVNVAQLEDEYIRNLQQQIYFLELETNHLRQQAQKAQESATEAVQRAEDRSTSRTSLLSEELQSRISSLEADLRRKDDFLEKVDKERQGLRKELQTIESSKTTERQCLLGDVATAQQETRQHLLDVRKLRQQEEQLHTTMVTRKRLLAEANQSCQALQQQLDQANAHITHLEGKEAAVKEECMELKCQVEESKLRDSEHGDCVHRSQYTVMKDDETSSRVKLKKAELALDNVSTAKAKVDSTCNELIENNARLQADTLELKNRLGNMQTMLEHRDRQKHAIIKELVELRQCRDDMQQALANQDRRLSVQAERMDASGFQIKEKDDALQEAHAQLTTLHARHSKLEAQHKACQEENMSLTSKTALLGDQLTEQVALISSQRSELDRLKTTNSSLRASLSELGARRQTF